MRCLLFDRVLVMGLILISGCLFTAEAAMAQGAAQRIEIPSSPNPVGSGARALGMGGAFIGVADDATAASWNPGGLIQLEKPEISIVGSWFSRHENLKFGTNPESSGGQEVNQMDVNYFSLALPFQVMGMNMIVSANYQHLYDFSRDWKFPMNEISMDGALTNTQFAYKQEGGLYAWGLAYCAQVTPTFSIGGTVNIWDNFPQDIGWTQTYNTNSVINDTGTIQQVIGVQEDKYTFQGVNFNLGFMWNAWKGLTIGGVFKSPFEASLKHERTVAGFMAFPQFPEFNKYTSASTDSKEKLYMPMSYGLGFSYRFSDAFTAAADFYRTEWGSFIQKDGNGNKFSPISNKAKKDSNVQPTHQVRAGMEYLIIGEETVIPIRAGAFYDPAPAEGAPDNYFGFALGAGLAYGPVIFDIAYQYRFGNDVSKDLLKAFNFKMGVQEHTVFSSLIIHLN